MYMKFAESLQDNVGNIADFRDPNFESRVFENILERKFIDLSDLDPSTQTDFIKSRASTVLPEEDLSTILSKSISNGDPLVVKFGIDPTGSKIHMGHAVPIILLERFKRMGHKPVLVIGDMTARSEERRVGKECA